MLDPHLQHCRYYALVGIGTKPAAAGPVALAKPSAAGSATTRLPQRRTAQPGVKFTAGTGYVCAICRTTVKKLSQQKRPRGGAPKCKKCSPSAAPVAGPRIGKPARAASPTVRTVRDFVCEVKHAVDLQHTFNTPPTEDELVEWGTRLGRQWSEAWVSNIRDGDTCLVRYEDGSVSVVHPDQMVRPPTIKQEVVAFTGSCNRLGGARAARGSSPTEAVRGRWA